MGLKVSYKISYR